MENKYTKNIEIEYTNVGRDGKLNFVQAVDLIQNNTTRFFEVLGSDNLVLKVKSNAIWVVTKTKINFIKYPAWRDKVKLISYITNQSKIRVDVETKLEDEDKNILFVAKQEFCPIDLETRRIRKIDTIEFPKNLEMKEATYNIEFQKLIHNFEENEKQYQRNVYAIDTDFSHHTNNVKYLEFIANTLDSELLDNNEITDLEIHYIAESIENQLLDVYKYKENNTMEFLIKNEERDILKAKFEYKGINS